MVYSSLMELKIKFRKVVKGKVRYAMTARIVSKSMMCEMVNRFALHQHRSKIRKKSKRVFFEMLYHLI